MERWVPLSAESMKQMLRCPRCYQFPICTPVFMCRLGHHICGSCYHEAKFKFSSGCESQPGEGCMVEANSKISSADSCSQCGAELIDTRNILAEQILQMMLRSSNMCLRPVHSEPSPPSPDSEWTDKEPDSSSPQDVLYERHHSRISPSQHTLISECDYFVFTTHSFFQADPLPQISLQQDSRCGCHHFSYEHPEIPMLAVEPGMTSHLHLCPTAIPINMARCISLLLVSGKGRSQQRTPLQMSAQSAIARLKNHLPLPLMAARIETNEELRAGDHNFVIMIWLGNAEPATLHCTLEATNVTYQSRSVIYSGPIGSLRESQEPCDVYARGDCLIINPGLLIQLSPEGGFDLNVVVH